VGNNELLFKTKAVSHYKQSFTWLYFFRCAFIPFYIEASLSEKVFSSFSQTVKHLHGGIVLYFFTKEF